MQLEVNDIVTKMIKARQAYYNHEPEVMSDASYDALEATLRNKEPDHPLLAKVGHEPSSPWEKATHLIPMGSLVKVNSESEFLIWSEKFPGRLFASQYKMDGLSLSLDYDENEFTRAVTRGGGEEGEDISENVKLMKNFLPLCRYFGEGRTLTGSVRAEVMLSKEDFDRINSTLPADDRYENPRNAAAGICRRLDGMYCKYLYLVSYDITERLDEDKKLDRLTQLGFTVPWQRVGTAKETVEAFRFVEKGRSALSAEIDGVVIKVCSVEDQETAGTVGGRPKAQIAWKFEAPGAATPFIKEEWDVGRTGVVTPLANLEPVKIAGSTIRRATLHNVAEIKRLGIRCGDIVLVVKANDVIPKIMEVIEQRGTKDIQIPTNCPRCQSILENDGVRLFCRNDDCAGRNFHRIMHWIKTTKIEQFGEAMARELSSAGKLSRIVDIYKLTAEDISSIEGWGDASAIKIMDNIKASKAQRAEMFLSAVGIPALSDRTAEDLLKAFESIEGVLKATKEGVAELRGYSDISASTIVSGLEKYASEITELLGYITLGAKQSQGGVLAGLTFCFTGEMLHPRAWFQDRVTKNGGRNLSGVTKELTHLVCNENKGSSKTMKAIKLGTKIIHENEFIQMTGGEERESKYQLESLFD